MILVFKECVVIKLLRYGIWIVKLFWWVLEFGIVIVLNVVGVGWVFYLVFIVVNFIGCVLLIL